MGGWVDLGVDVGEGGQVVGAGVACVGGCRLNGFCTPAQSVLVCMFVLFEGGVGGGCI